MVPFFIAGRLHHFASFVDSRRIVRTHVRTLSAFFFAISERTKSLEGSRTRTHEIDLLSNYEVYLPVLNTSPETPALNAED